MADSHVNLMHKLINHHKRWDSALEAQALPLSTSEVNDLLEIFESLGVCTKDGEDVPRA